MIKEESIQKVREIDLLEVIAKDVTLKKGANHVGNCPFHEEKSGSFTVSPAKGVYKCFGCGEGGNNAINYVMSKMNLDFHAAVKYLGDKFNIEIEETKSDDEAPEQKAKRMDFMQINQWAATKYRKNLLAMISSELLNQPVDYQSPVSELLFNRQLSMETIVSFQIGYAPAGGRLLAPVLKERGVLIPAAELGLTKTGDNGSYDIFRDRVIFPIHNERGEVVGFGGRSNKYAKIQTAKYINSPGSLVYKKDQVLYGLYQAAAAIRKMKFANLVEGYYDVASFHQNGMPNTVASCGTALTEGHAKVLKKYTSHIVLIRDNDKAGNAANMKDVDMLLRFGFKVDICLLPKGQDPDSFARTIEFNEEVEVAA